MNTISITPQLVIHYLQTLNVKFNTEKTLDSNTLKKTHDTPSISNDENKEPLAPAPQHAQEQQHAQEPPRAEHQSITNDNIL